MKPILISVLVYFDGAVLAKCNTCDRMVYEHQANLDRVCQMEGWVICILCALKLKREHPELFPDLEGQLWEGHIREPEPAPGNEWMLKVFNFSKQ